MSDFPAVADPQLSSVSRPEKPRYPQLQDAWPNAKPFALNGFMERHGFTPIWSSIAILVLALLVMNVVGAILIAFAIAPQILEAGSDADAQTLMVEAFENNANLLLTANALGLLFGLGLVGWLAARLTSKNSLAFLRIRMPDIPNVALAIVGWLALLPGLFWLGGFNQRLPQPQWLEDLEQAQTDMLDAALMDPALGVVFLLITVALAPAICEEILFRGYLQRQVERKWGVLWSILLVGTLFGVFHLRLTQAAPLALLGCYFGYVTWVSGSLWTASIIHLLNNGVQVIAVVRARGSAELDMSEPIGVAWYLGILSLLAVVGLCV
ncbi:MAG: CPBP family intramembrane glutamic endopeptidase, partial [Rubricoccaceae bacterium]|nr:CPBP family intramembrane glutamic endopeptidase [Rubricoccaceae bacterium]